MAGRRSSTSNRRRGKQQARKGHRLLKGQHTSSATTRWQHTNTAATEFHKQKCDSEDRARRNHMVRRREQGVGGGAAAGGGAGADGARIRRRAQDQRRAARAKRLGDRPASHRARRNSIRAKQRQGAIDRHAERLKKMMDSLSTPPQRKPRVKWVPRSSGSAAKRESFTGLQTSGESTLADNFAWSDQFVSASQAVGRSIHQRPPSAQSPKQKPPPPQQQGRKTVELRGDSFYRTDFQWRDAYDTSHRTSLPFPPELMEKLAHKNKHVSQRGLAVKVFDSPENNLRLRTSYRRAGAARKDRGPATKPRAAW